jgi:heme/copper-type cytochrome/quinol oxidase subunit 1
MLWSIGFLVTSLFGGLTGKMLNDRLGKIHFWMIFVGFHTTFLVHHWLGAAGMRGA